MNKESISRIVSKTILLTTAFALCLLFGLGYAGRKKLETAAQQDAATRAKSLIEANLPQIATDLMRENSANLTLRMILLRANFADAKLEIKVWDQNSQILFESDLFTISCPTVLPPNAGEISCAEGWMTSVRSVRNGLSTIGTVAFSVAVEQSSSAVFRSFLYQMIAALIAVFSALILTLNHLLKKRVVDPLHRLVDELPNLSLLTETSELTAGGFREVNRLRSQLIESYRKVQQHAIAENTLALQLAEKEIKISVARQVAHDIRSPLSALKMALPRLNDTDSEASELMIRAITRINAIANDLLKTAKNAETVAVTPELFFDISRTLRQIIKEKQVEYGDFVDLKLAVRSAFSSLFARGTEQEFSRLISNLINNSVEALDDHKGQVKIDLSADTHFATISIEDSGRGIPIEILAKIGQPGFSFGKKAEQSGSGLGIFAAKKFVENLGGQLDIKSNIGHGTTITFKLPRRSTEEISPHYLNPPDMPRLFSRPRKVTTFQI